MVIGLSYGHPTESTSVTLGTPSSKNRTRETNKVQTDGALSFTGVLMPKFNKEGRPFPVYQKCGKKHQEKYLADINGCFRCDTIRHKVWDCLMAHAKARKKAWNDRTNRSSTLTCQEYGKSHKWKCLVDTLACFRCFSKATFARLCKEEEDLDQLQGGT